MRAVRHSHNHPAPARNSKAILNSRITPKKQLPLAGRRIVITRSREQAATLRNRLERYGAEVIELPTIEIHPPRNWARLDRAIRELAGYDWLIFTSANGVRFFLERLRAMRISARTLGRARICAIGPATGRALRQHGLRVDRVPDEYRAEGVVAALSKEKLKGKRILIPRARVARDLVPAELRKRGARVDLVAAYRTLLPREACRRARRLFSDCKPDLITFTSSSTAQNFVRLFPARKRQRALQDVAIATIGPITSDTVRKLGFRVSLQATRYTIPGLARAIVQYFRHSAKKGR